MHGETVKITGYFRWRRIYIYDSISLNSSEKDKCFRQNCRENQTQVLRSIIFLRISCLYEIMWKNVVHPNRPQMMIQKGVCALQVV
jgi:hypothetical protein